MSGKALRWGGLIAATGVGYYLYTAGGDPKVAQKHAEADAARASNKVKEQLPGDSKEVKKRTEAGLSDVNAKVNQWTEEAKAGINKFDNNAERYRQDASKHLSDAAKKSEAGFHDAVDKFDKTVTKGVEKAQSGVSSWFGGSSK